MAKNNNPDYLYWYWNQDHLTWLLLSSENIMHSLNINSGVSFKSCFTFKYNWTERQQNNWENILKKQKNIYTFIYIKASSWLTAQPEGEWQSVTHTQTAKGCWCVETDTDGDGEMTSTHQLDPYLKELLFIFTWVHFYTSNFTST